ncbi:MAG: hypothetical protein ACP5QO_02445 [Clostridia bacterium]
MSRVRLGVRRLELLDRGTQFASRVSVELVADTIVKTRERAGHMVGVQRGGSLWVDVCGPGRPGGQDLDWTWEPVAVGFHEPRHPFLLRHPLVMADDRLRTVLGAQDPDPSAALAYRGPDLVPGRAPPGDALRAAPYCGRPRRT